MPKHSSPVLGRRIAPVALGISASAMVAVIAFGGGMPYELHVVLVLSACSGYLAMIGAARRWGGLTIKLVGTATVAEFVAAIVAPVRGGNDLWWYDMYGRILTVHHANPYTHSAADFPRDPIVKFLGGTWLHAPSVYGPLFSAISGAASTVLGASVLPTRLFYQGLALAAVGGASVIIWRRTQSAAAVAFLTAQPVIALYVINGGRNDILVGVALLGASVLAIEGRSRAAGVVGALAGLIKLTGVVGVVALVASLDARRGRVAARRAASAALAVLLVGYLIATPSAALAPFHTAGSLFSQGSVWQLTSGIGMPATELTLVVLAAVVLVVLSHTRARRPAQTITATLTALSLGAPYTLPPYVAWALPVAALDHETTVSQIAAWQAVVLVAGHELTGRSFGGPAGSGLREVAAFGVPAASLILLVMLLRVVRHRERPRWERNPQRVGTPDPMAHG